MGKVYFISGIDTDAGKSYCTGWLAREWTNQGQRVITQKFVQTGDCGYSEDIDLHRKIMDVEPFPEDIDHTTAPMVFSYPCSPHLAARLDNREIDFKVIESATDKLSNNYDVVLIEGAGGLIVPLKDEYLTIDYIKEHDLPLIFVVHGGLGSINHALLGLEAIKARGIRLEYLLYNKVYDSEDSIIADETRKYLGDWVKRHFPDTLILDVPRIFLPPKKRRL